MNAVEIEEAVSNLALEEFDSNEFPYNFLTAFGNKLTTIKKLRSGTTNKSDLGGVLQRNNIHIKTCKPGEVDITLKSLKESLETKKAKSKFILSTDGNYFAAEDLISGEIISCEFVTFPDYFGFFLPLAGISTVSQIKENSIDIKATGRLNKLYLELLRNNPNLDSLEKRDEMNHFMARFIFCFFAEDTDIFGANICFTETIEQMSKADASDIDRIILEIFQAMNIPIQNRSKKEIPRWANRFPYVNGSLFSDVSFIPKFSKIARSYLIHIGNLDWQKINPDIFGSMIQAITEDQERSSLGLHYTSVPNILKVLNPLILDELKIKLNDARNNERKLLNLRNRLSKIRIFDPACGSGNFLVIAYKEMRAIEDEINIRRKEEGRKSDIPLTNFRGIEIRNFASEIARLALIIAEYQCNLIYLGQKEAIAEFLPLKEKNWIRCGNALRTDWIEVCPPIGKKLESRKSNLLDHLNENTNVDFKNEGGETYICGNPPYVGASMQDKYHKSDMKELFEGKLESWKSLDYVSGWFFKAAEYSELAPTSIAFVTTNSMCQGLQVPLLWPKLLGMQMQIYFAHLSFKWKNLATNNAGVTVVIIGLTNKKITAKKIYSLNEQNTVNIQDVEKINPYLSAGETINITPLKKSLFGLHEMVKGNYSVDGGHLILSVEEAKELISKYPKIKGLIRPFIGSSESIRGSLRYCIWLDDDDLKLISEIPFILDRINLVKEYRLKSKKEATKRAAKTPHKFDEIRQKGNEAYAIVVPVVSSENRDYMPATIYRYPTIINGSAFAVFNAPLWNFSIICSKIHLLWIGTVCGKLKTDYRYSNTLGWNTFPIPSLTTKNKTDLNQCAENILLARESYFPTPISKLYEPNEMPVNLKEAHKYNDEILERIYVGRLFRNDSERLEKLFNLNKLKNK